MEALFLSCLIGGVLFTIVSVLFGDWLSLAFDGALDFLSFEGHRVFQPAVLAGGITIFGGAGLLLQRYTSFGAGLIIVLAVLGAVLLSLCMYFFYFRPMERSEMSTGYSIRELTGLIGEVSVPIPAQGYGEVLVKVGAGVTHHIAGSFEGTQLPSHTRVVVVEVDAAEGTLLVSKLDL